MSGGSSGFSRRDFLLASGATLAAGLPVPAALFPARAQVSAGALGDAHVHLFNLADLAARGFFEHSVMWNTGLEFWLARPMWAAMLDMIEFLKCRTITAREELQAYPRSRSGPDIDKDEFDALSTRRISNMGRQSRRYGGLYALTPAALSEPQRYLRDSYYQLGVYFRLFGYPVLRQRREPDERPDDNHLDDATISRIKEGARKVLEGSCLEDPSKPSNTSLLQTRTMISRMFDWAWLLVQSRQYHLEAYLERIREGALRPRTIVNLLVDYDEWLGDGPRPGSDADAQIALWHRIATDPSCPADIRTFAGFDPLRDGLERLGHFRDDVPAGTTTFARNRAHLEAGRISGFKLYPPMGFRPIGNHSGMFRGRRRALGIVRDRLRACGIGWEQLPGLLNDSLNEFYLYCGTHGVPILAHAYHSNDGWHCAAARAGPSGWRDVQERYDGLRICLGHFAQGGDFVRAAEDFRDGRRVHPRNWPFHGVQDMLLRNRTGGSQVYVDLSDMVEFLHRSRGEARAVAFFRALKEYCGRFDPECRYFMFGTDWIMLEREGEVLSATYVERLRGAMAAAGWTDQWQQNLLHDNLQRFLQPRASAAA